MIIQEIEIESMRKEELKEAELVISPSVSLNTSCKFLNQKKKIVYIQNIT